MADKRPIIVTGAHRSGTTWVGKMIALADNVRYIHEPFNIDEPRIHPLNHWFEYVSFSDSEERQKVIYDFINEILDFNLKGVSKDIKTINGPRDVLRFTKDSWERTYKRPLLKDPIAVMSTDWIAEKFNADVIALIRHPAAFVASLKVKNWAHVFDNFVNQPGLMEALKPYKDQIITYQNSEQDIIDQGILLWNLIYYRIHTFQQKYKNWIFVKHEDLSLEPILEFKKIYDKLGLKFTSKVEMGLIKSTSSKKAGHLTRDSKKNITTWKKRLNDEEIKRIKKETSDIAGFYYSDNEW